MPNPYNNEIIFNGQTLISLKEDTVTPDKVLAGETFHDRSGAPQTGTLITHNVYDDLDSTSASDALSANQGRVLNGKYNALNSKITRMFEFVDEKYVTAGGTFSFTLDNTSSIAFVTTNFGNGIQSLHIIGSRNSNETAISAIVPNSYLTLTNNGLTITGTCTYTARVTIYKTIQ